MTTYANSQTALDTILKALYSNDNTRLIRYNVSFADVLEDNAISFDEGIIISNEPFDVNYPYQDSSIVNITENYTLYVKTAENDIVTKAMTIINLLLSKQQYKQTNLNSSIMKILPKLGRVEQYQTNRNWFSINIELT